MWFSFLLNWIAMDQISVSGSWIRSQGYSQMQLDAALNARIANAGKLNASVFQVFFVA